MSFLQPYFKTTISKIITIVIKPKSSYWDDARREFTLNVLLLGSIILATVGLLTKSVNFFLNPSSYEGLPPFIIFIFLLFLCFLLFLSRIGKVKAASFMLVLFLFISATFTNLQWGVESGQGLLTQVLVIVMSGILLGTKPSLVIAMAAILNLIIIFYIHQNTGIKPDLAWKHMNPQLGKVIVYGITFALIAIISWLSNREIERALRRAKRSEAALRKQRDQLEILVEKRTKELKKTQAEKLAQLYRFAEFGRLSSGLFHDLVNPLNIISLNLQKLTERKHDPQIQAISDIEVILERAVSGTKQLEKFIQAARKQMQNQETLELFSLREEILQTIQMLEHKAKSSQVKIQCTAEKDVSLFGNPIKFGQVIINILANAIDAYEKKRKKTKVIEVHLTKSNVAAFITIQDFGSGISKKNLPKIFEPLFTTKSFEKGTGIGLSISKHIVEKEFNGKIHVQSDRGTGTIFTIEIPTVRTATRLLSQRVKNSS